MSVAFTKEDSAATASETQLPDRPISEHPNLVAAEGLQKLKNVLVETEVAYEAVQRVEDIDERRRLGAIPLRDVRYFAERIRIEQLMPAPNSLETVVFGATVTFRRADGRIQKVLSARMKRTRKQDRFLSLPR